MERLTKRTANGKVAYALLQAGECVDHIDLLRVWGDRLAAYEDTGLEPYEIEFYREAQDHTESMSPKRFIEIAQAEKDGRLVVLPCKVGDKVYRVITTFNAAPVITEIEIKTLGQAADMIGRIGEKQLLVSWYLTREEAEAALKKREADNETD